MTHFFIVIPTYKRPRHSRGLLAGIQTLKEARHSHTFNKPSFPHVSGGNLEQDALQQHQGMTHFFIVIPACKRPCHSHTFNKPSFPHVSGGNLEQDALQQHQSMTHFLHRHSHMQKTTSFPRIVGGNPGTKKPSSFPHASSGNPDQDALQKHQGMTHFFIVIPTCFWWESRH